MPDMKKKYVEEVRSALAAKLGIKNVMEIPKLEKIVISTGIGSDKERDAFTEAQNHLAAMTGQKPLIEECNKLAFCADEFFVVGDSLRPFNIMHATHTAFAAAYDIATI